MSERAVPGVVAPERRAGRAELEQLLSAVQQRRLRHAARERAAGTGTGRGTVRGRESAGARASGVGAPPGPERRRSGARASDAAGPERPAPAPGGGVVLELRDVSPTVFLLRVSRPAAFEFQAGQAVKIGLPGSPLRRSYSIASAPDEPHLEFCIERVPGGRLSSLLHDLAPGERLELAPKPRGSFTLQVGKPLHLMVATVTGIAPLRSMLRSVVWRSSVPRSTLPGATGRQRFWVLHGSSYADELPYADELAALARQDPRVRYLPTLSRPEEARNRGWGGRVGRVEAHVLATAGALGAGASVAVYACGHAEMVRNVQRLLAPLGYAVSAEEFG